MNQKITKKQPKKRPALYSLTTAAAYVGLPRNTFKNHVMVTNRITGHVIGRSSVFTRPQLDDYKKNGRTKMVVDGSQWLGTPAAAAMLGMPERTLAYHTHQGAVPAVKLGTEKRPMYVFWLPELEAHLAHLQATKTAVDGAK